MREQSSKVELSLLVSHITHKTINSSPEHPQTQIESSLNLTIFHLKQIFPLTNALLDVIIIILLLFIIVAAVGTMAIHALKRVSDVPDCIEGAGGNVGMSYYGIVRLGSPSITLPTAGSDL